MCLLLQNYVSIYNNNCKFAPVTSIFLLVPSDHGRKAYDAIKESLAKLDCGYIDLYLIHWPGAYGKSESESKLRAESWRQLIRAKKEGLVKNIGVSNYTIRHLKELLDTSEGIVPVVNQVSCILR